MQVVILAAGKSSRFYPYTDLPHKTSVSILGKPILVHTLESIKKVGITDVILVISDQSPIKAILQKMDLGLHITYVVQPEPKGMGDALVRAKEYISDDFFLLNASHVDFHEFADAMRDIKRLKDEIVLLANEEKVLSKFGVLSFEGSKVLEIVEKPEKGKEPSNLKVIGIYLLTKEFIDTLEISNSHHYSLESAISNYAKHRNCTFVRTDKESVSLKYVWDILGINKYLLKNNTGRIGKNVEIAKNAIVDERAILEDGVKVYEGACIKGPCFVGKNTIIGNNALLREYVSVEEKCVIGANTEIRNSVLFSGTKIHSGFIGDSVIGEDCRIGAYFCSANRRLDREEIKVKFDEVKIPSGLTSLGVIMGNEVKVGVHVATMPGVVLGNKAIIGPATSVIENVDTRSKYYSEFTRVVKKYEKNRE